MSNLVLSQGISLKAADKKRFSFSRLSLLGVATSISMFAERALATGENGTGVIDVSSTGSIATGIKSAKDDAAGVGGLIIAFVIGVVIFSIIIGMIKKA